MNRRLNVSLKIIALILTLCVSGVYATSDHDKDGKTLEEWQKHAIDAKHSSYQELEASIDTVLKTDDADAKKKHEAIKTLVHLAGVLRSEQTAKCDADPSADKLGDLIDSCIAVGGVKKLFEEDHNADAEVLQVCGEEILAVLEHRTSSLEKHFAEAVKKGFAAALGQDDFKTVGADRKKLGDVSKYISTIGARAKELAVDAKQKKKLCDLDGSGSSSDSAQTERRGRRDRDDAEEEDSSSGKKDKGAKSDDKAASDDDLAKKPATQTKPVPRTGPTDAGATDKAAGAAGAQAQGAAAGQPVPQPVFGGQGSFDPSALGAQNNGADLASLLPLLNAQNDRPQVINPQPNVSKGGDTPATPPSIPPMIPPTPQNQGGPQGGPDPSQMGGGPQQQPGINPAMLGMGQQQPQQQNNAAADWQKQYQQDQKFADLQNQIKDAKGASTDVDTAAKNAAKDAVSSLMGSMPMMGGMGGGQGNPNMQMAQANNQSASTVGSMLGGAAGRMMGAASNAFARGANAVTRMVRRSFRGTGISNTGIRGAPEGNVRQ